MLQFREILLWMIIFPYLETYVETDKLICVYIYKVECLILVSLNDDRGYCLVSKIYIGESK